MLLLPLFVMVIYGSAYLFKARSMDECFGGALSFFIEAQASLLYYCLATFVCRDIRDTASFVKVFVEEPERGLFLAKARASAAGSP